MIQGTLRAVATTLRGRLGREASLVAAGMLVSIAGQAVTLRVITSHLSRAEFGLYGLTTSVVAFVQMVAIGALVTSMTRLAPEALRAGQLGALERAVDRLARRALALASVAAVLVAAHAFAEGHTTRGYLALATTIYAYGAYRSARTQNLEQVARLRGTLVLHMATEQAAQVALLLLTFRVAPHPAAAPFALGCGALLVNAYFGPRLRRVLAAPAVAAGALDGASLAPRLLALAVPLASASVMSWAVTNGDRWALERFVSLEAVGAYQAAAQISGPPFGLLAGMMNNFAGPILFGRADHDPSSTRRWVVRIAVAYAGLAALGYLLLVALSGPIVRLLVAPHLRDAVELIPWLAAGWALLHLATSFVTGILAVSNSRALLAPNLVSVAVAITANLTLVRAMGVRGAGVALVLTGGARAAAMAFAYARGARRVDLGPRDLPEPSA